MKMLALFACLASVACASTASSTENPKGPASATTAAISGLSPGVVDAATARQLVTAGVKVVDVRTPAEYAAGHVPGALNIPHDEMERRFDEVGPASTPVLLYCRTGHRSGIAGQILREKGFSQLYDMKSYDVWARSEPGAAAR